MPCRYLSFCYRGFCLHPSSSRLCFTRGVGPLATRASSLKFCFRFCGATGVTSLKFCSYFHGTTGVTSLKLCSRFYGATGVTLLKSRFGFLWSDWGDLATTFSLMDNIVGQHV